METVVMSATKVSSESDLEQVSEWLAVAAVLVQDMKESRLHHYKFNWERMLNFNGDTGIFLQYTHARLHSLLLTSGDQLTDVIPDYSYLVEDPALRLARHLARYDEALLRSYSELEPFHLVQYLFTLGRLVNVAHDELYVKGQPVHIAKARLELYKAAKTVVASGMLILGITPLDRI